MANRYPWLTVVIVISDDIRWRGPRGMVGTVAAAAGDWTQHDVFVCGSPAMVASTVKELVGAGVPEDQIKFEEFSEA
jgi:NAD(P)H-flavin reductase